MGRVWGVFGSQPLQGQVAPPGRRPRPRYCPFERLPSEAVYARRREASRPGIVMSENSNFR
jgi:hypothetical protein